MNNKTNPLVSICIPAYNADKYITATITALLNQTYSPIEIVIVDDASSDDTIKKINEFSGSRISLLANDKKGAASARNYALLHSKGDYIVFFDADDLASSNFIETQLQQVTQCPDAVVVSAWGRFYGNDVSNFKLDTTTIEKDLTFYDWVVAYWTYYHHTTPPGRVLIPRAIIEKAGLWDESLNLNDDLEFFTRVFLNTPVIRYNAAGILYYRSGINGLSSACSSSAYQSYFKALALSLNRVEESLSFDENIALACANLWQMFIYHVYPRERNLLMKAEAEIKRLGGATIKFPAGGKTEIVSKAIGWKWTKRIKALTELYG